MYTHNGRVIEPNKTWTSDDGYKHPSNWSKIWSDADLKTWSVTQSDDPVAKSFDNRFYHGYKVDGDGNETDELIPRSLDDVQEKDSDGNNLKDGDGNNVITIGLKNYWIAQKKAEASVLLSKTDWYIVRNAETTTAIPSEVTTERDNIRSAMTALETKINNAGDLDAFIALFATSTDESGNRVKSDMDCF